MYIESLADVHFVISSIYTKYTTVLVLVVYLDAVANIEERERERILLQPYHFKLWFATDLFKYILL